MLSVEGGWWCPCQTPGNHPPSCAVGHNCKCSAHLTLLSDFCSLGHCRRGSHHSLQESTDCTCVWGLYPHVNNSQQLILWANIQILASLTCACYSVLLWFMLGMAVVVNEIVMLGYLLTDNTKKNNQWQSIIAQLSLFWQYWVISSLTIKMDGFCPCGCEVTCRILTKQCALAGKQSQRHKHGSLISKDFWLWGAANSWIKWCFLPSHTLWVGGSWQRKVWLCLALVVPVRLQFDTWNVRGCGTGWAPLCHPCPSQVPLWGQGLGGQSCSGPSVLPFVGKKMRMQPAAGWQESRNSLEHRVINESAPFPRMMLKISEKDFVINQPRTAAFSLMQRHALQEDPKES